MMSFSFRFIHGFDQPKSCPAIVNRVKTAQTFFSFHFVATSEYRFSAQRMARCGLNVLVVSKRNSPQLNRNSSVKMSVNYPLPKQSLDERLRTRLRL